MCRHDLHDIIVIAISFQEFQFKKSKIRNSSKSWNCGAVDRRNKYLCGFNFFGIFVRKLC